MTTGKHIVLEGVDGSGKSALCRHLVDRLEKYNVRFCSNKQIAEEPPFVRTIMRTLFSLLWPKKSTTFDHLLPLEYWIHLQATWYSLHSSCVVRPRLLKGEMLISDGWYYKFAAKLKARGLSDAYIRTIFSHIAKPNLVVLLDGDIAGIWDRKKRFRHHEMGLHHNYARLGKESFVDYQSKIFRCLKLFATTTLWRVVKIDVSAPIDQNVDTVARSIENCLL